MSEIKHNKNEAGNILIYILGAIFLLGILVVMVKGSSTPGSNIDKETLLIRVSEVQDYGQELERAIAYILRNGHSEADIRFAHPDAASAYGDITDTPTRQVFSRDGGGARYRTPPAGIQTTASDWLFTGSNSVGTVGSGDCITDACVDLIVLLTNVTEEFCIEINNRSGMNNPGDSPPLDEGSFSSNVPFAGSFTFVNRIRDAAPATDILNKTEGCFENVNPSNAYHYYRVLLAR